MHNYTEALTDACKAIAIDARYGKAYYRKGIALTRTGHPTEALKAFRAGLALTAPGPGRSDFELRIQEVELSMRAVKTRQEPGVGVVAYAAVPFNAGQTVLCEPPILTWGQGVDTIPEDLESIAKDTGVERHLIRMLEPFLQSTLDTQKMILSMYCPSLTLSQSTLNLVAFAKQVRLTIERAAKLEIDTIIRAIMICRVNSHQCALVTTEGTELCGVFPNGCRLMHSCAPNLIYHKHEGVMKFVAVRPIREDEVLSFSYIASRTLVESNWRRRKQLQKANLFTCQCRRCQSTDWTRGFRCKADGCCGTVLWTGAYEEGEDSIIPMVRFEAPQNNGWLCDTCDRRHYEYELPLDAEAGLEKTLDSINTEDIKVENKYHNLKHVFLSVREHIGERHWTYAQLSVLLCKYHRIMALAMDKASSESPLGRISQTLAMHWGFRYLSFLKSCGSMFWGGENTLVTQLYRIALGRSCVKFIEMHKYARGLYEECLPFFTVVYGEADASVLEMAAFVVECKTNGIEASTWDEAFPQDPTTLFETWEQALQQNIVVPPPPDEVPSTQ
jgi:hypothetical protein